MFICSGADQHQQHPLYLQGTCPLKVAPYCLSLTSFDFNYSLLDSVTEKLLLQTSKSSISRQSGAQMKSTFVAVVV